MANEKIGVFEFSGVLMPDYFTDYISEMKGYHTALSVKATINSLLAEYDQVVVNLGTMYGGAAYELLSLVPYLQNLQKQGKIVGYVSGLAASAGAVIATVLRAQASKYSQVMYHGIQMSSSGSVQEIQADVDNAIQLNNTIKAILIDFAGVEEDKATELVAKDNFIMATDAVALGLLSGISENELVINNSKSASNMFGMNITSAADLLNVQNQLSMLTASAVGDAEAKKDAEWSAKVTALQNQLANVEAEKSLAVANAVEAKSVELTAVVNSLTTQNEALATEIAELINQIATLENKPNGNTASPAGGDDLSGQADNAATDVDALENYYRNKLKNR